MYRTKLARTLLVLGVGASPACEHADPISSRPIADHRARPAAAGVDPSGRPPAARLGDRDGSPAVGNIGQTGRPAARLGDRGGSPAVGNIGQTGRPAAPLIDRDGSPAVGNIGQTGRPAAATPRAVVAPHAQPAPRRRVVRRLAVDRPARAAPGDLGLAGAPELRAITVERPLVNRELRPAVGNTVIKGRGYRDEVAAEPSRGEQAAAGAERGE